VADRKIVGCLGNSQEGWRQGQEHVWPGLCDTMIYTWWHELVITGNKYIIKDDCP
jgi:hypothetical protein